MDLDTWLGVFAGVGLWNMIKLRATKTSLMNFSRMKTQFYSAKQRPTEKMVDWVIRLINLETISSMNEQLN